MWKCKRCDKPVYFAERKQSIGFDWHPECLRCDECGKRLNPGQHSEHKGVPYCDVPCYGALFGPQLFGHGTCAELPRYITTAATDATTDTVTDATRGDAANGGANRFAVDDGVSTLTAFSSCSSTTASSPSFDDADALPPDSRDDGGEQNVPDRETLERKLRIYNKFYENFRAVIQSREKNGKLIMDGVLKLYWGVSKLLQFKEDDDQRPIVRKRLSHYIEPDNISSGSDSDVVPAPSDPTNTHALSNMGNNNNNNNNNNSDEEDCSTATKLQYKRGGVYDSDADSELEDKRSSRAELSRSGAVVRPNAVTTRSGASVDSSPTDESTTTEPSVRFKLPSTVSPAATGSNNKQTRVLRRRPGRRMNKAHIKRRCSINGHFYNRETSVFTPPHGSVLSVWVTSLVTSREMIQLVLDKYRIEDQSSSFALYIIWDTGERRRLKDIDCPLISRLLIGPSETAAKLFLMDANISEIRSEVAQYINLSLVECTSILQKYREEEELQVTQIKEKYAGLKEVIRRRMLELKVQL